MGKAVKIIIWGIIGATTFLAGYFFSTFSTPTEKQTGTLLDKSLTSRFREAPEKKAEPSGLFLITEKSVGSVSLSSDGKKILYYLTGNGEVRMVPLSDLTGDYLSVAILRPKAERIDLTEYSALAYYGNEKILYLLGNYNQRKLTEEIIAPALHSSGRKYVYNYLNSSGESGAISVADVETGAFKNIMPTRSGDWLIGWKNNEELYLLWQEPGLAHARTLYSLNPETGELTKLLTERPDLNIRWSPDGSLAIVSFLDKAAAGPSLFLFHPTTKNLVKVTDGISVDNCAWGQGTREVYCLDTHRLIIFNVTDPSRKTSILLVADSLPGLEPDNVLAVDGGRYVVFRNKKDETLRGFRIEP